jgi:hypothetical protein
MLKCLSIHQPYADLISAGLKTIECRSWQTSYRGDILICSTKKPYFENKLHGQALCIITLENVIKMNKKHCKNAYIDKIYPYAWILKNPKLIKPFPVKGQLGFFELPINLKDAVILL